MSIYIYSGEDMYRLEEALKKLLVKNRIDRDHTITIDASDRRSFRMESVLMECDTLSLFDEDMKAVIVKDPFFLNASGKDETKASKADTPAAKKRKEKEAAQKDKRMELLEQYLKNPNPSSMLIFYCHGFNADSRKKEYKMLTNYGAEAVVCKQMDESGFAMYVDEQLKKGGYTLSREAKAELLARVSGDTLLLHNALAKMDLYGEKKLDLNDIRHLVSLNSEVNIFNLTTAFAQGNLQAALQAVDEMISANYDYNVLISLLAKRLRVIYNMRLLNEQGCSNDEIAARMHVKSGYVYFVLKDSGTMNAKAVLTYLKELADLDQGIKQGKVEPKYGFEQFLLRNGQRKNAGYRRII